jgi:phosphatidylglycerol---prolipoprotein diacylglyceryl transferase
MFDMLSYIHWNFNPDIFVILGRPVRWYGLMFAIGFVFGYKIVEKQFKYENENLKWLENLLIYIVVGTVVGARLGHVFFYGWEYYSKHPLEILFIWQGGLASHGGTIGVFIALYLFSKKYTKRSVFWIIDRVVIPTAIVAMLIRFGNLFNSEIYGVQTTLPWGFIFERAHETVAKHPTQIYEALAYLLTFFVVNRMYWKSDAKSKTGLITGVFFIMVFTARFFIEFVKEDQEAFESSMFFNMGQWLSIPFIIGGIVLVVLALRKGKASVI